MAAAAALGRLRRGDPASWSCVIVSRAVDGCSLQVQDSQSKHMDRFLVCGERYRALRDAVARAMMEGTAQGLLQAQVQPTAPSR